MATYRRPIYWFIKKAFNRISWTTLNHLFYLHYLYTSWFRNHLPLSNICLCCPLTSALLVKYNWTASLKVTLWPLSVTKGSLQGQNRQEEKWLQQPETQYPSFLLLPLEVFQKLYQCFLCPLLCFWASTLKVLHFFPPLSPPTICFGFACYSANYSRHQRHI